MELDKLCFVCLTHTVLQKDSNNSFRYIFHYLKMRNQIKALRKDCSPTKLQLCLDCTILTENFSVLYKQLEKVEMEMKNCLKLICDKIVRSEGEMEECRDIEDVREELMSNCAKKFRKFYPQLTLTRLRTEDIQAWKSESPNSPTIEGEDKIRSLLEDYHHTPNLNIKVEDTEISFGDDLIPSLKMEDVGNDLEQDLSLNPLFNSDVDVTKAISDPLNKSVWNSSKRSKSKRSFAIPNREQWNMCPHCHKVFSDSNELDQHLKIHTRDAPHQCSECLKCYTTKSILLSHKSRVHQNKDAHKCTHCSKGFATTWALSRHIVVHTGSKPKCPRCSKELCDTASLRKHLLIHDGIRSFGCPTCMKTFVSGGDLRRHKRVHKSKTPVLEMLKSPSKNKMA